MEIKDVIKLSKSFWTKTGQLAIQWIRSDAEKGKFQNNTSNYPYKSEEYKKYKANDMRRFTSGKASGQTKSGKDLFLQNKKAKTAIQGKGNKTYGSGQRLKAYYGLPIESRQTSFINMVLTGRLFKGFKVKKADPQSVTIGFNSDKESIGKLLGAEERGTSLLNLSNDNREKVKGLIVSEFNKNKKALPKLIKIFIKI
jgi:hypothetical protein